MGWINIYGFIVVGVFMIPNIIFMIKNKDGLDNLWKNKTVEIFEQIGRFGCIAFMIINIPYTWFGFWFNGALSVYLTVNICLTTAYCTMWFVLFHRSSMLRALALSILPSVIFLFSGIMIVSIPLIIAAIIFTPCHILISYKNVILAKD
jgi:hypothetical protein